MRLVEFSVTNYRSITTASKISLGNYTVLVGKNNEGKSNILTALNVSMQYLIAHAHSEKDISSLHRDDYKYNWERDFPSQLKKRKSGLESIFKLNFRLEGDELQKFHEQIHINGNDDIPITIKIGRENKPDIRVPKRGTSSYNKKSTQVTTFISERICFNYIPAIRTGDMAIDVLEDAFYTRFSVLRNDSEYVDAEKKVLDFQTRILDEMSEELLKPLQVFLPKLSSIKIESRMRSMFPAYLNNTLSVTLDDGISTNLRYKGDGIKSLFAMAILKDRKVSSGASVVAIEEPESHLHSGAIHDLVDILTKMSENSQVIISTHNPLFVRQNGISSNIIVNNGTARPAKRISEIRDVLGVWASDNLRNAQYVVVVEGDSDKIILSKLLPIMGEKIKQALISNLLVIKSLDGVGNLSHDLADLKNQMCKYVVLVDNDQAGKNAINKAKSAGLLLDSELRLTICNDMVESEIEDCIKYEVYKEKIQEEFSITIGSKELRGNTKWSDRMRTVFLSKGLPWDSDQEKKVKIIVAQSVWTQTVKDKCEDVLVPQKATFFSGLVEAIEKMLEKNVCNQ